jgi:multisubunit Na+/H+ antiporter MnhB subunit
VNSVSSNRKIAAIILGVVALLFLVAAIIFLAEPAKDLPSFMGKKAGSTGHHELRMIGCFVVAVVAAAGAWVSLAYRPKAQGSVTQNSNPRTPAGTN